MSIKSNAIGLDSLHPRFIKILLPTILPSLTHFFNNIIVRSAFPTIWKSSKIVPICKRYTNPMEYRPISILPFLSKAFEKVLHTQIVHYLENCNLLSNLQSGFRAKHSCTTALLKITDDIRISFDNDEFTALVLLDFSKAFDRVDHRMLLRKLRSKFNFCNSACTLIWSYLRGRKQKVICNDKASDFLPVLSGVPQGSILGPLLFSIFINDLPLVLRDCNYHLYADDIQLYISRSLGLMEDAICRLNNDLMNVSKWAVQNRFNLNASKSSAIIFYKTNLDTSSFPSVILDNIIIPYSDSVKNLGIIFNRSLSWVDHINSVVGKVYGSLRKLSSSAAYTPKETRLMLVRSLLIPLISYGCEIFIKLDSVSTRKLNVAFNSAVRYIYGLRRFDHVSPFSKSVVGCSLDCYLKFRAIMFLRNLTLTKKPFYLYSKLEFSQSGRTCSLNMPRFCSLPSERQFFVQSVRLWSLLPIELRRSSSSRNFQENLFEYMKST